MWWGSILSIPTGWALCDGTHGTPNLRDKMVIAAGGGLSPGNTGGSASHQHNLTTDGHAHLLNVGAEIPFLLSFNLSTDVKTDTATTAAAVNQPPYYSLAYIMYRGN